MNNLHISLTSFKNESRLLKEAKSLLKNSFVSNVFVAALHEEGLKEDERLESNLRVTRFKLSTRKWGANLIVRLLKYFEFCMRVYFHHRTLNIKSVNVHSLGLLPLGYFLKLSFGAKLIYDAHELETESNGLAGFRQRLAKFIERNLIKRVDGVIVVSESIADWYQGTYDITRPAVVMNVPWYRTISKSDKFRDELGIKKQQKIFLYQGLLSPGRGIELIIDTFKTENSNNVVVFMGYGVLEETIKSAAGQHSNIFFFPAVSPEVVLNYTASADVGISIIENVCLSYYYCMPNKMFEYAMAGIPTIVSNMKEMSHFVNTYKAGAVIEENKVEYLRKAITDISSLSKDELKENCYNVATQFSWETQEKIMLDAYTQWGFRGNI